LPYGIKAEIKYYDDAWELLAIYTNGTTYAARDIGYPIETYFEDCKPYLFPLSSMTKEQKEEYHNLCSVGTDECGDIIYFNTYESIDYLNKNKFDYRYLIPMGLAIDATGLNIY
jgi:hypothetical protein